MTDYKRRASRIIDTHTHLWEWHENGVPFYEILKKYRKINDIDYVGLTCVPYINHKEWKRDASQNIMGAIMKLTDDRFYVHGGLVYTDFPVSRPLRDGFDFATQLSELRDIGFDGVKMLETKPSTHKKLKFPPNSPEYDEYYAMLERERIPIIWHVNDPEHFWGKKEEMDPSFINAGWWFGDGTFASNTQIYDEVYDVLRRFPNLTVTFAHMYFMTPHPDTFVELMEKYPNLRYDITPNPFLYYDITANYARWKEIFETYPDRILLGTDRSTRTPPEGTVDYLNRITRFVETDDTYTIFGNNTVHGIGLDSDKADMVLYRNFKAIDGDEPKKVNLDALMAYIDKYLPTLYEGDTKDMIVKFRQSGKID